MLIKIEKNPKADYPVRLLEWVTSHYKPMSEIEGYEPHSMSDDLSNVIFMIEGKFYGPIRQSIMPQHMWIPLSRFMVKAKNSKKNVIKTDIRYSSQYHSRCVLLDPQGVLSHQWWTQGNLQMNKSCAMSTSPKTLEQNRIRKEYRNRMEKEE